MYGEAALTEARLSALDAFRVRRKVLVRLNGYNYPNAKIIHMDQYMIRFEYTAPVLNSTTEVLHIGPYTLEYPKDEQR